MTVVELSIIVLFDRKRKACDEELRSDPEEMYDMKSWIVRQHADLPSEEQTTAALQSALEDTLRQIHSRQRRASDDVCQLLDDMAERLYDPEFGIQELELLCPPGSATYLQFLIEIGHKPEAYFEQCRFDMARYLVCESDVPVGVVAERLGFQDPKLFSKWFDRRSGMTPKKLRIAQRAFKAAASQEPAPIPRESWPSSRAWHQCLLGCARHESAASLIQTLRAIYPGAARGES